MSHKLRICNMQCNISLLHNGPIVPLCCLCFGAKFWLVPLDDIMLRPSQYIIRRHRGRPRGLLRRRRRRQPRLPRQCLVQMIPGGRATRRRREERGQDRGGGKEGRKEGTGVVTASKIYFHPAKERNIRRKAANGNGNGNGGRKRTLKGHIFAGGMMGF